MGNPGKGELGIGLCGCGYWGKNYVRSLLFLRDCRLNWVCDLTEQNLETVRAQYPQTPTTKSLSTLLQDAATQAIVVATPARSHHSVVLECLNAGKHVLCEKPLAMTEEEARELVELAEKKQRVLMVGHTFLYNPAVRKMKDLIRAGEIGQLYYIKAVRSHLGLIREDVNVVWDLATHDVSIINYLLDAEPEHIQAAGSRFLNEERDDVVFATLRYRDRILAEIQASWLDSGKQRLVEVVGSRGRIVFDDLNALEPIRLFQKGIALDHNVASFGEYKYLLRDGDIISPNVKMLEPLRLQSEHFVECVREQRRPLTDGRNGLAVVRTVQRIDQALHGS